MPWFRVDDKLWGSPKWLATPARARALWCTAGAYCADQLTDGVVRAHVLPTLGGTAKDAENLVRVGLWETDPAGWRFHDWSDFQPSREQVLLERAGARERQQRARERAREAKNHPNPAGQGPVSRRDTPVTNGVSHAPVTPVVTVPPTRPDPTHKDKDSSSPAARATATPPSVVDRLFDTFWQAYPRRVGKESARKAFGRACQRAGGPTAVLEGARRLAADPNLPDREFIPHPTTWLNRGGWDDEPLPPRASANGRPAVPLRGTGFWEKTS